MPTPARALAAALLAAAVLAFPVGTLARLALAGAPAIEPYPSVRADLLVVTASRWRPAPEGAEPAFDAFDAEAAVLPGGWAPSVVPAASAASLWTGRWPASHGVRAAGETLAEGSWTLARAARRAGARTAAFLEEPLATAAGIGGFELVRETPGADVAERAEEAARFVREAIDSEGATTCTWVHLADSGPGGVALAAVVERMRAAYAAEGRARDLCVLVAGFGRGPAASGDERFRAPLRFRAPGGANAGRSGSGAASLVDAAALVVQLLRLPRPDPARGEAPLAAGPDRVSSLWRNLSGRRPFPWILLEDPPARVVRFGEMRVELAPDPETGRERAEVGRLVDPAAGGEVEPVGGALHARWVELARTIERLAGRDASAAGDLGAR